MPKKLFLLFLILASVNLQKAFSLPIASDASALVSSQIEKLDVLIRATEQSLKSERKLKELVLEYKQLEKLFLQSPEDNEVLLKMAKQAAKIIGFLKETHLPHLFDPEFMEELAFLTQAAAKRGVPKP